MEKPKIISTVDKNSFAHYTLVKRFPSIIQSVIDNNKLDDDINKKLGDVIKSIQNNQKLELLESNSEVNRWINHNIREYHYSWNNAPFLFVENYLYHLLCQITYYYETGLDFFSYKKNEDVLNKLDLFSACLQNMDELLCMPFHESFMKILFMNLNGNMADLSHLSSLKNEGIKLLIDDTDKIGHIISIAKRVDIILDNSGEELFFDLILVYWLLKKTQIETIHLHFKCIPYFVSDAMKSDFYFLMDCLKEVDEKFIEFIFQKIGSGNIILCDHTFWSDGYDFNQLSGELLADLNRSDLLVFKGDLNYRKLIEDRYWKYTTPTSDLLHYFDTDCALIRVLKSEVVVGLQKESIPCNEKNEWLYNAKYGIIEYVGKSI